jgi:phosphatidate cytidylyltransferase
MATLPGEQSTESTRKLPSNLTQRILTGVILLPIVLLAAIIGGWPFTLLTGALACVGVAEFCLLAQDREIRGSPIIAVPAGIGVILAFHFGQDSLWIIVMLIGGLATFLLETIRRSTPLRSRILQVALTLGGVLYVAFPTGFLVSLRGHPDGLVWLMLIFALTWGTDSLAYIGGRLWGKTLLAPHISPKKTREGALVGIIGGIVPGILILLASDKLTVPLVLLVAVGPFIAILGDLVESGLKRAFGVKDSHIYGLNILPGHGGVLDRVDALILVTFFCYVYLHLFVLP